MKYAFQVGSGVMICIPSFIELGSAIQTLIGGGVTKRHGQHNDRITLLLFFKNKERRLKIEM
jgi:hypothetical protein